MSSKVNPMKKFLLLTSALVASTLCAAQELGRVISATPVIEQVAVPRQVCTVEQVTVQPPKSGAGAVMGAIAGGAMGNAIGDGSGRTAATVLGLLGGAILGDRIEGAAAPQTQNVQRCTTQTFYESRTMAYNVVYEYAGKQYSVQMPNDPGPTIQLSVTPVGASALPLPSTVTIMERPVYAQPPVVVVPPPVTLHDGSGFNRHPYPSYPWRDGRRDFYHGR